MSRFERLPATPGRDRTLSLPAAAPVAVLLLLPLLALGPAAAQSGEPAEEADGAEAQRRLYTPDPDVGVESLEARAEEQSEAAEETGVPAVDFRFTDELPATGITFVHEVVDDAGRFYKAVHYDHGNGLAVADVDGDDLLDIYFTTQLGRNELWRNRGDGTFEDITEKAGVAVEYEVGVTGSFADTDNDGDPDLYVTTVNMGNHFFENVGGGRFEEITERSGLGYEGHSSGALFFDYDRDGDLDLFLANIGTYTTSRIGRGGYYVGLEDAFSGHHFPERLEPSRLFENRGGNRFVDVTEERQIVDTGWTGDAAFADLDRDGWPDLYVLNMQGDDHVYRNVEGKRFEEIGSELFPKTPWGAMGIDFFDFDDDGDLDLILTDMHSDMSEEIGPEREQMKSRMQWSDEHLQGGDDNIFGNALYRREEDGSYTEISDAAGVETYWPWGLSTGDLDADGDLDLFVANSMSFPWRYQPNSVLINEDGERFHERAFHLGVEPRRQGRTHVPWFEVDCSGADRTRKVCADKEGTFLVMGTLGTRSSAIFDLEGDGDLDIVTNELNAEPQILVSDLAQRGEVRWLKVELEGRRSNRDGLGAMVRVQAGDDVYTRYHDGKSGYLSQSSMPLYFGLGDHRKVDSVTVEWPSGLEQTVSGPLDANTTLEIVEEVPEEEPPGETDDGAEEAEDGEGTE